MSEVKGVLSSQGCTQAQGCIERVSFVVIESRGFES